MEEIWSSTTFFSFHVFRLQVVWVYTQMMSRHPATGASQKINQVGDGENSLFAHRNAVPNSPVHKDYLGKSPLL